MILSQADRIVPLSLSAATKFFLLAVEKCIDGFYAVVGSARIGSFFLLMLMADGDGESDRHLQLSNQ